MGHLLMIESWVGSMSTLLPRGIHQRGDRFSFLTRDLAHYVKTAAGTAHPLLTATNIVTADTNDEAALLPYARRLHTALEFDGVLSSCDYYLPTVAAVAAELGLPGPSRESVAAACDKERTRRICAAAGVPQPDFAVAAEWPELADAAERIGFPLVVKPVDLCGGMFVRRVENGHELRVAVEELAGFPVNARGQRRSPLVLLEECLDGPEFSVETVTFGGRTTVVGITDKPVVGQPWFIEAGHMFPAALEPAAAAGIGAVATAAIAALGLDSTVAHTEIKLTGTGPKLVEVNPRPAGNRITELVRRVTGIDLAAVHADLALGREPDLTPLDTGIGSAAIAFLIPEQTGVLREITGAQHWPDDARIVDHHLAEPGKEVTAARNNNGYLGHVMVAVDKPEAAGPFAQDLIAELKTHYDEPGTTS
ncbi:ATP-grasp domain-containing protein [Nocardia sp. 2]|uniref:ATP-grasp domain-containing protein n=1 Tax=Nocardia acididurans TaxID=2802282 RepID=A0ABS1MGR6_9NOCA|nr:ATP-grasp domain-containing protein [Nocardia acididurans]MBL1079461.1 ATP-grasp domain-containing protein [Nocardia acididurans]